MAISRTRLEELKKEYATTQKASAPAQVAPKANLSAGQSTGGSRTRLEELKKEYATKLLAEDPDKYYGIKYSNKGYADIASAIESRENDLKNYTRRGDSQYIYDVQRELDWLKSYKPSAGINTEADTARRIADIDAEVERLYNAGEKQIDEIPWHEKIGKAAAGKEWWVNPNTDAITALESEKQRLNDSMWYFETDRMIKGKGEDAYNAIMSIPSLEEKFTNSTGKAQAEFGKQLSEAEQYLKGFTQEEQRKIRTYAKQKHDANAYESISASASSLAENNPIIANAVVRPVASLTSGIGVADVTAQALGNAITGRDTPVNYKSAAQIPYAASKAITDTTSDNIEKATEGWIGSDTALGNLWTGAYQIGTSLEDSAIVVGLTAMGIPGAQHLLGGSAATSSMHEVKERGGTDGQALMTGLLSGLAESFFEKVSIDKLFSLSSPVKETVRKSIAASIGNIAKQSITEGSEELFTTLANTLTDALINGDASSVNVRIRELETEEGYSHEEAVRLAYKEWGLGLLGDFIGGMVSGSVFGGVSNIATGVKTTQQGKNIRQQGNAEALLTLASQLDESMKSAQVAQELNPETAKNAQLGYLYNQVQADTLEQAVKQRLDFLQVTDETAVSAAVKSIRGESLNRSERQALNSTPQVQRVVSEYNSAVQGYSNRQYTNDWAQDTLNEVDRYEQLVRKAFNDIEEPTTPQEQPEVAEANIAPKAAEPPQAAQEEPDTQNLTETPTQAGTIEEASKKYGAQAGAMLHTYQTGQDVAEYDAAYSKAFTYATAGVPLKTVKGLKGVSYLTENQIELAYEAGKAAALAKAEDIQKNNKVRRRGKSYRKGTVSSKGVKISDLENLFNDPDDKKGVRSKAYKILVRFAEATGVDIVLYNSATDASGNFYAEEGRFSWDENKIYIDINAGLSSVNDLKSFEKHTMVRTFSHEFVHFLEKWNPVEYLGFRDLVIEAMDAKLAAEGKGTTVDDIIESRMDKWNAAIDKMNEANPGGEQIPHVTYEEASREVVAEAMTEILPESTFVEQLYNEHRSVFDKLVEKLKEFLADIKAYFEGVTPNTKLEAALLREDVDGTIKYVQGIVDAFDALAKGGVENYQSASVESPTDAVPVEETTQFSVRSLAEAGGFRAEQDEDGIITLTRDGSKVHTVTVEDINNSAIGALINFSLERNFISETDSTEQKKLFADLLTMAAQSNDFAMTMQFAGSAIFTAIKSNSDKQYNTTYDFPSICTKTQAVIDAMSAAMMAKKGGLTKAEIEHIYNEVFHDGNPVPCPECYVFSRWVGIGSLLDNMWTYQNKFANMTAEQVQAQYLAMEQTIKEVADENGLTLGRAKGKLATLFTKRYNELYEKISKQENQGEKVSEKDRAELAIYESNMDLVKSMTWIDTVYFKTKDHKTANPKSKWFVDSEVLFDLNAGEYFATMYPAAWKFRTTQGAGYGKAITPYSEAVIGEGILGTANINKLMKDKKNGTLDNVFLDQKGTLDSAARKKLDAAIKKMNNQAFLGGQRFQSTSDARFENAFDYLIAALEVQAMNGMVQVYTKVPGAVPSFAAWGFSTNQSLMPKGGGLDANGRPIDTSTGGMNPAVARENREQFDTQGTITIGVNDNHIRALMKQVWRDFIIPYHASGGDATLVASFRSIQDSGNVETVRSTDYTRTQGDKVLSDDVLRNYYNYTEEEISLIKARRQARKDIFAMNLTGKRKATPDMDIVRGSKFLSALYDKLAEGGEWAGVTQPASIIGSQIFPNEYWDQTVTYEESGKITQDYLDYCKELGFLHRFSGMAPSNGTLVTLNGYDEKGNRVKLTDLAYNEDGSINEYFWKVLTDRRMYDNNGNYLPQRRVSLGTTQVADIEEFAGTKRYGARAGRQYDPVQAAATAKRVAAEITGRQQFAVRDSKDELSPKEHNRLTIKKPIKVSRQEMAMLRTQRKTKYSNLAEDDIPTIDFLRIGDYRVINNAFIYYIRNSGLDDFTVVMKKRIVPNVRRMATEGIDDENRRNDAAISQRVNQEKGKRGSNRGGSERTGNGREIYKNDQRTVQIGEPQRDLHFGEGNPNSGTVTNSETLDRDNQNQIRESNLSNAEVLVMAADAVQNNDARYNNLKAGEKEALNILYKKVIKLRDAQQRRLELLDQKRDLIENKETRKRGELAKVQNNLDTVNAQIKKAQEEVLRVENQKVLRDVLKQARKVVERDARQRGYEELQEYRAKRNESEDVKKYRERIKKTAMTMSEWLRKNSDKEHVPEVLKKPVAELLASIDFSSKRFLSGGELTQADEKFRENLAALQTLVQGQQGVVNGDDKAVDNIGAYLDLSVENRQFLDELVNTLSKTRGVFTINEMSAEQLKSLSKFLQNLATAIRKANKALANARYQNIPDMAYDSIKHFEEIGNAKVTDSLTAVKFISWTNATPYYAFKRFGAAGEALFDGFTRGWEKLAMNAQEVINFTNKTYKAEESRKWKTDVRDITLESGEKIQMTIAQIMELSQLLNREQARKHIEAGGIRIGGIPRAFGMAKQDTKHYHLTAEDITKIVGLLTQRQLNVAEQMRKYMGKRGGEWGNEISMARFGYEFYTEGEDYYTIRTDANGRPLKDTDAQSNSMFRLLNLSSSKSLNPNANNALIVGDIFDTFADHMADMAKLNALGLPILDAIKWYNFTERTNNADGTMDEEGVKKAMETAFGEAGQKYFTQLIKDINGTTESGDRGGGFGSKLVSNYKIAAVAANLRVALLQPTSYVRASYILKPSNMIEALLFKKNAYEEAMKYSGTAVWKSLGYYDTDIAQSLRSQIEHDETFADWLKDKSMILAEWGDKRTWGRLWVACKLEAKSRNKSLTGEALNQATADLFREVIYATQVMDSTLTRSEIMRGSSRWTKAMTAFMSEPTLSANMLMDAASQFEIDSRKTNRQKAWAKNSNKIGLAFTVYVASAAAAAVVESIADAFRDDDEYEDFVEKFLQAFIGEDGLLSGNFAQNLTIVGKIPILKDVVDTLKGSKRSDMGTASIEALSTTLAIWRETFKLANGTLEEPTSATWNGRMTNWGKIYKTLQALSQLSGFAVSNLTRDVVAIWNTLIAPFASGKKIKTYDAGAKNNIKYAVQDGTLTEEEATQLLLEQEIVADEDEAYWTIQGWEAGNGYSRYDAVYDAVRNGTGFDEAMAELTSHGYTEDKVTSRVKSKIKEWYKGGEVSKTQAVEMMTKYLDVSNDDITKEVNKWSAVVVTGIEYDDIDDAFLNGEITADRAVNMYTLYGGMAKDTAQNKVGELTFKRDFPELDGVITYTQYKRWQTDGKPNGVSLELFTDVAEFRDNGTSNSVRSQDEVAQYIESVASSRKARHALWCCFYKASTSPWR